MKTYYSHLNYSLGGARSGQGLQNHRCGDLVGPYRGGFLGFGKTQEVFYDAPVRIRNILCLWGVWYWSMGLMKRSNQ